MNTDPAPLPADPAPAANGPETWEDLLALFRRRFPSASDGILFCVHRLQTDPEVSLKHLKQDAESHGIKLGGRSLHSAKVLLGLAAPAVRRPRAAKVAEPELDEPEADPMQDMAEIEYLDEGDDGDEGWAAEATPTAPRRTAPARQPIDVQVRNAVRQIQDDARAENERLRSVLRAVLDLVDETLAADDYDA